MTPTELGLALGIIWCLLALSLWRLDQIEAAARAITAHRAADERALYWRGYEESKLVEECEAIAAAVRALKDKP